MRQLKGDFEQVRASTNPNQSVEEFEAYQPQVLVLAFDSLAKAELYYLGLYRRGQSVPQHEHRSVILCHKDEVRAAFDLCKRAYFDDYVLYWPQTHDGPRLAMSIWIACREMTATQSQAPPVSELRRHARHLADLEKALNGQFAAEDGTTTEWARALKAEIEPALAGTRELGVQVRKILPTVLVVEDDDFTRQLIRRTLDPLTWTVEFVGDAPSALGTLRRLRPDVVLMDIRLPGMDGLALTRHLKANKHLAGIPVIMMTGDARRETLLAAMEAGAAEFVVKPFTRESLTGKIEKVFLR